ncbi:MAG: hypothetical protein V9G20_30150 [Candidatus Promineifilaceae bacterium]
MPRLPYGYHKAEYFSAVIIGIFIAVAALVIFARGLVKGSCRRVAFTADPAGHRGERLGDAPSMPAGPGALLRLRRREEHSPALVADGQHLDDRRGVDRRACSLGVMLAAATGFVQLDAILAALVAVTILWSGWQLMQAERHRADGRGGGAAGRCNMIRELISSNADGRHRSARHPHPAGGPDDVHRVPPRGARRDERSKAAHAICDRIEAQFRDRRWTTRRSPSMSSPRTRRSIPASWCCSGAPRISGRESPVQKMGTAIQCAAGEDYRSSRRLPNGGSTMNLNAPTQVVFWIAVVVAVVAIISTFVAIPVISTYAFWVAILAFVILAGGTLMKSV